MCIRDRGIAVAAVRDPALRRQARSGLRIAAPQIALEFAGDGLTGRLRQLGGVPGLLQRLDVLGDLAVLGSQLVHAQLPGAGVLAQLAERDADVEQVLQPVEQRQAGLGVGRLGDVVRHRRPQAHRRDARVGARLLEDADDARGAFVARLLQIEPGGQVRVGGDAGDRNRPGVRGVAEQRAQHHHHLHAQLMGEAHDFVAERAPAHAGLDAADQDEIAPPTLAAVVTDADDGQPGRGPCDLANAAVQEDGRAVHLEVVVVLRVQRGEDLALPFPVQVRDRGGGGVTGVVPAFERGHHDRVDQLGNPLELDHPRLLPTGGAAPRRSPVAVPLRASPSLRRPARPPAAPVQERVLFHPTYCEDDHCWSLDFRPWSGGADAVRMRRGRRVACGTGAGLGAGRGSGRGLGPGSIHRMTRKGPMFRAGSCLW